MASLTPNNQDNPPNICVICKNPFRQVIRNDYLVCEKCFHKLNTTQRSSPPHERIETGVLCSAVDCNTSLTKFQALSRVQVCDECFTARNLTASPSPSSSSSSDTTNAVDSHQEEEYEEEQEEEQEEEKPSPAAVEMARAAFKAAEEHGSQNPIDFLPPSSPCAARAMLSKMRKAAKKVVHQVVDDRLAVLAKVEVVRSGTSGPPVEKTWTAGLNKDRLN